LCFFNAPNRRWCVKRRDAPYSPTHREVAKGNENKILVVAFISVAPKRLNECREGLNQRPSSGASGIPVKITDLSA
jgi:hypothetical protein